MAILYQVSVVSINAKKNTLELLIQSAHPDAMYFSENLGFAIRLLRDSATGSAPIAKAIDNNCLWDEAWMKNNVTGFITECKLLEVRAPEPVVLKHNGAYAYWSGEVKQSSAILSITLTHSAWFAHLSLNASWGSTAYDTEVDYISCKPIAPDIADKGFSQDYSQSGGWVAMNAKTLDGYLKTWPEEIYIHHYSQKSYNRATKISHKELSFELMNELLFKTVFILTRIGTKSFGTLVTHENGYGILTVSPSGKVSCGYVNMKEILTIGLAEFDLDDSAKVLVTPA